MLLSDLNSAMSTHQFGNLINHTATASNIGCNSSTSHTQLWKGTQPKNETGAQQNVDRVCEPENAHCNGRITGAAKNRVDQEKKNDGGIAPKHDPGEVRSDLDHIFRPTHPFEQFRSKKASENRS